MAAAAAATLAAATAAIAAEVTEDADEATGGVGPPELAEATGDGFVSEGNVVITLAQLWEVGPSSDPQSQSL